MAEDLHKLEASTLHNLDRGVVAAGLDRAILQAARDCLDRPGDKRPRKITLQLNLKPIAHTDNNSITCEGATGSAVIRTRLPDYESQSLDFGVKQNGSLIFSEFSPHNHRQGTLFGDGDDIAAEQ